MFLVYGQISPGSWPAALAGWAPSATVAAAEAGQVKAPRGDGHALRAEDGSGQGHHHGRGLNDDGGVLALPDTGLIAAAGQGSWATGPAWHTLAVAGHVLGLEVHLGERVRRK